jgi:hypothetical protein
MGMSREEFMDFFRDDQSISELSPNDRIEIFKTILIGSSDITKDLLDQVLQDYCVSNLEVREIGKINEE